MSLIAAVTWGAAAATMQVPSPQAVSPSGITRPEAVRRADRLFELLDANHDGVLTAAEARQEGTKLMTLRLRTGRDETPGIGGQTLKYFRRALASDVSVDRKQFEETMLAHFDEMDTDHDGILTADERQAGRHGAAKRR